MRYYYSLLIILNLALYGKSKTDKHYVFFTIILFNSSRKQNAGLDLEFNGIRKISFIYLFVENYLCSHVTQSIFKLFFFIFFLEPLISQ